MKIIKNNKLLLKILSCIIAIFLWFAITYTEDPVISQSVMGINLTFEGEEALHNSGLVIVNKNQLPEISVVIRGNRSNVIASLGSIYAMADVSKIKSVGKNDVEVRYSYLSNGISLVKSRVNTVTLDVERLVSREIPVKLNVLNREKNINLAVEPISNDKTVTITGAESVIYKIAYAKADVDIENVTKLSTQECVYKLYDEEDNLILEDNIIKKSHNTISIENNVYNRKELPIKVVLDSKNRKDYGVLVKTIDKKTVQVGIKDNIQIEYLEAVVDLSNNEDKLTAKIVLPDGVYLPEEERVITLTGDIIQKQTHTMRIKIMAKNVPNGKKAIIDPEEKLILVKSIENPEEIKVEAFVDLKNMTSDEEEVKIDIISLNDIDTDENYTATVKLEAGE